MTTSKPVLRLRLWQLRIGERRTLLLVGDFFMATLSLFISLYYWGVSEKFMGFTSEFLQKRVPAWFYIIPLVWLLLMVELYDVHRASDWRKTIQGIALAALMGLILYLFLYFYYSAPPKSLLPRRGVASYLILVSLLTLAWRLLYIRIFNAPQFMRQVLLVGGGQSGQFFLQAINGLKVKPFAVAGIIDDDPRKIGSLIEGVQVIGTSDQLKKIIEENDISDLIVAITGELQGGMFQALLDAQEAGTEITRMPVSYEELFNRVPILSLEADWILNTFVDRARVSGFYEMLKRLLDILGALVGISIMLLVLPFVSLITLIDDGWPVFYFQMRSGCGGQPYRMIKFRTMSRDAEADGQPRWASEGDQRATRWGRFLRKTHIDELPQFFNVLRGDMSLVGPRAERPELVEMFQQHIPFYRSRLLVKPGITGWAQVNFGYASTIEETVTKLEYDLYYITHRNIWMDLLILLKTPAMILGFRGR
ncbi:MAG: sugar transferase [Anaerolineales bacterium]|nr:sugar transferase [Anaerolineales bacterium]